MQPGRGGFLEESSPVGVDVDEIVTVQTARAPCSSQVLCASRTGRHRTPPRLPQLLHPITLLLHIPHWFSPTSWLPTPSVSIAPPSRIPVHTPISCEGISRSFAPSSATCRLLPHSAVKQRAPTPLLSPARAPRSCRALAAPTPLRPRETNGRSSPHISSRGAPHVRAALGPPNPPSHMPLLLCLSRVPGVRACAAANAPNEREKGRATGTARAAPQTESVRRPVPLRDHPAPRSVAQTLRDFTAQALHCERVRPSSSGSRPAERAFFATSTTPPEPASRAPERARAHACLRHPGCIGSEGKQGRVVLRCPRRPRGKSCARAFSTATDHNLVSLRRPQLSTSPSRATLRR